MKRAKSILHRLRHAERASVLIFSEPFTKNIDAARRFMVGYIKGVRDYNDTFQKGKGEVVSVLTKYTSQKDPALYDKMVMPYLSVQPHKSLFIT